MSNMIGDQVDRSFKMSGDKKNKSLNFSKSLQFKQFEVYLIISVFQNVRRIRRVIMKRKAKGSGYY